MDDPFLLEQNSVETSLQKLQQLFDRWRQMRDQTKVEYQGDEQEFEWLTGEILQILRGIHWDLDDLESSLQLTLESRKIPLTQQTIECRQTFLEDSRKLIKEISDVVSSFRSSQSHSRLPNGTRNHTIDEQVDIPEPQLSSQFIDDSLSEDNHISSLVEDDDLLLTGLMQDIDDVESNESTRKTRFRISTGAPENWQAPAWLQRNKLLLMVLVVVGIILLIIIIISTSTSQNPSASNSSVADTNNSTTSRGV